jgi:hypothetical protein
MEALMQLQLTEQEAALLHELLGWRLGSLSVEISHTDNPDYRRGLRAQRDSLRRIYQALAIPTRAPAADRPDKASGDAAPV